MIYYSSHFDAQIKSDNIFNLQPQLIPSFFTLWTVLVSCFSQEERKVEHIKQRKVKDNDILKKNKIWNPSVKQCQQNWNKRQDFKDTISFYFFNLWLKRGENLQNTKKFKCKIRKIDMWR